MRRSAPLAREVSPYAIWGERLVWLAVPLAGIAVLALRARQVEPLEGLGLLVFGALLAAIGLALGAVALVDIWKRGCAGGLVLFRLGFVALLLLAGPGYLAVQAVRLPVLNDISTDPIDPPRYADTPTARALRDGAAAPVYDSRRGDLQRRAYPDLRPLVLESDPAEAFALVHDSVVALKWRIVSETPPGPRGGEAAIEAVAETRLLRFRDDVVIRLRRKPDGTHVDIRSASRIGRHDLGANAARIRRLIEEITAPRE